MEEIIVNKEGFDNTKDNPVLEAAKLYIGQGISVIPIVSAGKRPAIPSWKPYQSRLATAEELELWFGSGKANIGIVTGKLSGITVLDFDTEEAWEEALCKIPSDTPLAVTAKGYHLYCRHHESVKNDQHGQVLKGMDIRSEGGYVVAPPSVHESGVQYAWFGDRSLNDVSLAELPFWVINAIRVTPDLADLEDGAQKGNRNDALTRLVGNWVTEMSFDEVVKQALAWNQKCEPPDDEQQVFRTVKSIWEREHAGIPEDLIGVPWEPPVLFDRDVLPEIKADMLPGFLGDYARAVSNYNQAPEALAVMIGLSVVATCLQKKFVVSPYGDEDFLEPLNLWTVTALKPSERKTPVFNAMTRPLKQWEREKRESLEGEILKVANERDVIGKRIEILKKNAANADSDETRIDFLNQINDIQSGMPSEIIPPRLWIEDVTAERLQQMLADHDEKIALLSDEGGIFEVLAGMYSNGKINVDVLLQSYSGSSVRIERGGRAAYLDSPALTFGLTVQPGILRDLGVGAKRKFRDNGLLARFLYCVPEGRVGTRDVRRHVVIPSSVKQAYDDGIHRLLNISRLANEDGITKAHVLRVSDAALDVWYDFAQEVENILGEDGELASLSDWGGKLAGNALRVAGNYHVVKGRHSTAEIDAETMKEATELCRVLIPHAKAAFGEMGKNTELSDVMHVLNWVKKNGRRDFSKRDCQYDNQSRFQKAEQLDPVLREMVERVIIRPVAKKGGRGRKPEEYEVNPQVLGV